MRLLKFQICSTRHSLQIEDQVKAELNTSYFEEKQLYHVMVDTGLFAHICLKRLTFIEAKLLRLYEVISGYICFCPWVEFYLTCWP